VLVAMTKEKEQAMVTAAAGALSLAIEISLL
jgi:hypothetical protein